MQYTSQSAQSTEGLSAGMTFFFACAGALILANIYYAQPILADMAADIGLAPAASGGILTLLQIGYMLGILFMGPLGDALENRKLIAGMVWGAALALWTASASGRANGHALFFAAQLGIGFFSSATQIQLAFAAGLAGDARRGRVLGALMAGLFLGMILSRPLAGLLSGVFGWRTVYRLAGLLMLALGLAQWRLLPGGKPAGKPESYPAMLRSMARLPRTVPQLPRLLALAAIVFTAFCMFWTATPLALRQTPGFSPGRLALFTLLALVTPTCVFLAGRLLDRGFGPRLITLGTILTALVFGLCACLSVQNAAFVPVLAFSALLLDPGICVTTLAVQQDILSALPEARSRLNTLSVVCNFCSGALGSAAAPWLFTHLGWRAVTCTGCVLLCFAFALNARPNRP